MRIKLVTTEAHCGNQAKPVRFYDKGFHRPWDGKRPSSWRSGNKGRYADPGLIYRPFLLKIAASASQRNLSNGVTVSSLHFRSQDVVVAGMFLAKESLWFFRS
jgi:hypothetical protein